MKELTCRNCSYVLEPDPRENEWDAAFFCTEPECQSAYMAAVNMPARRDEHGNTVMTRVKRAPRKQPSFRDGFGPLKPSTEC